MSARQLTLIDSPKKPWKLTEKQRRIGRTGIANARAALAAGSRLTTPSSGGRTA